MAKTQLKLGTRKSLLAWAQSSWVAREIERLNPGVKVELFGIETRGDVILDVSLNKIEGKEFFVAELDHALKDHQVDFTVHSMKDLSLERPEVFVCGAIPKRENPRDVILFGPNVMERLASGKTLRIGTSSPRRIENIPPFLKLALPRLGQQKPQVELVEIRGNVNTRLSRVHEKLGSERHLDGVVLAFAGIIRLWNDDKGRAELEQLLQGCRWMILPLRECPAAPGQGALAIECRRDDETVRGYLAKMHDGKTFEQVKVERALLAEWGGGCHQKFGATVIEPGGFFSIRGAKPDGEFVDELRWNAPAKIGGLAWDGGQWRSQSEKEDSRLEWKATLSGKSVFITHARAVAPEQSGWLRDSRVWTSGTGSWFKLAVQGVWVEGSFESQGFEANRSYLEPVLGLGDFSQWSVLTHQEAVSDWGMAGEVIPTYAIQKSYTEAAKAALSKAELIYWSSGSQFDELGRLANPKAAHACGGGKTAIRLQKQFPNVQIFPSIEEWRKWTQK